MPRKTTLLHQLQKIYPKTTSVVDADTSLAVEVTKEDVQKSRRKDMNNCAIAVSCKRGNGKPPDFVIASRSRLYTITKGKAVRYTMPHNAVREITSFDRGATFTPGVYTVTPAAPSNRLGCGQEHKHKGGHTREGSPVHHELINNIRATIAGV